MDKKRPDSWREFFLSEEKADPDFLKDRKQPKIEAIGDKQKELITIAQAKVKEAIESETDNRPGGSAQDETE